MSMTDDLMGMSAADKEAYAKEEREETAIQQGEEEWNSDEFDDIEAQIANEEADEELKGEAKREKARELYGLIVDTRDWLYARPSDIYAMNYPHCRKIRLSAITLMGVNRFLSASNFRDRAGN